MNFAFKEKQKLILSNDIIMDVMDETRRERKILMVLRDANVDQYIKMDMTEIDIENKAMVQEQPEDVKLAIHDKIEFRAQMAQTVFITRLDYIFRVLKQMYERKATISDPEAFKDKIRALERRDRHVQRGILMRQNSSQSNFSLYSKSMRTGLTYGSDEKEDEDGQDDTADEHDEYTNTTHGIANDPIMLGLTSIFDEMEEDLKVRGRSRIEQIEKAYDMDDDDVESYVEAENFVAGAYKNK